MHHGFFEKSNLWLSYNLNRFDKKYQINNLDVFKIVSIFC